MLRRKFGRVLQDHRHGAQLVRYASDSDELVIPPTEDIGELWQAGGYVPQLGDTQLPNS